MYPNNLRCDLSVGKDIHLKHHSYLTNPMLKMVLSCRVCVKASFTTDIFYQTKISCDSISGRLSEPITDCETIQYFFNA